MNNENLTKEEAIEHMKAGFRVTHRFFEDHEFIEMTSDYMIKDEKEYGSELEYWFSFREGKEWETGWSIYKD